ncbi:MAG: twin-arginine translocase subunit TatC, partial [Duncaniella sp.]|nr:twin-arginine translocase subunit TatC [Duncaniella sp.]
MEIKEMGFWDHVDALRSVLLRGVGVVVFFMAVYFAVMPELFDRVILAPFRPDFCLYTFIDSVVGVIDPERS